MSSVKNLPRDGKSRFENLKTQPLKTHRVFNNPNIISDGWYPVVESKKLKKNKIHSFKILDQKIVLWRNEKKEVQAIDSFCPHMGADLGNGKVVKDNIQCYFHQWEFGGCGKLKKIACKEEKPEGVSTHSWPTEEKYGFIWVYSSKTPAHPVPNPPSLKGEEVEAIFIKDATLFAHHHVLMASGIDLQHFSSVHNLDIDFKFEIDESVPNTYQWNLEGKIPSIGLKAKFAKWLMGEFFRYNVSFSGGSITSISYGDKQKFRGIGKLIPSLNILWGAVPLKSGVSQVKIFLVTKKRKGLIGWMQSKLCYLLTMILLIVLRDEDIKAFPNMRFQTGQLIKSDESVSRLIQLTNKLPVSDWSLSSSNGEAQ